jgi:serine protease
MVRRVSWFLLAILTGVTIVLLHQWTLNAQTPQLYYTYRNQRIPLSLRQDVVVAKQKPTPQRGTETPFYQQVQQRLNKNQVRGTTIALGIQPLRENYALLKVGAANVEEVRQQLTQQTDLIESLPPVLKRPNTDEIIVLPNEIVVQFASTVSDPQVRQILQQQNLELIRPISQKRKFYLVRLAQSANPKNPRNGSMATLNAANQLATVAGVNSAMPNFIQANSAQVTQAPGKAKQALSQLATLLKNVPNVTALQWHLNSAPLLQCLQQGSFDRACWQPTSQRVSVPRHDLRAIESWQNSRQGEGVVVAVIDTLIQWDHPDLQANLYTTPNGETSSQSCIGKHGWDFVSDSVSQNSDCIGDDDTRVSNQELNVLRPRLQASFLPDEKLLGLLSPEDRNSAKRFCEQSLKTCSNAQLAGLIRDQFRSEIGASFHGTEVAGVVTARSPNGEGLLGVAPKTKLLPIRAGGIGETGFTTGAAIQALEYAEAQKVDVINMSFGSDLPDAVLETAVEQVLTDNPKLVIVVAAGNSNQPEMGSPANIEDVIAVGATSLEGQRTIYSNYGKGLDVVAPGGQLSNDLVGGIVTAGGTFKSEFWQGMKIPNELWGTVIDPTGKYLWTQGTSFASPAIAGVIALMKGEDPQRQLSRDRLVELLKQTASYDGLRVTNKEKQTATQVGGNGSVEQFVFGNGLVNAQAAVQAVQQAVR